MIAVAGACLCVSAAENGLVFKASFDRSIDAEVGRGDRKLYWAPKMEVPARTFATGLPTSGVVTHEKEGGVTGGYLKFQKKAPEMVFFQAKGNMPVPKTNWSGTVSSGLDFTPDEDLEPGFTDPIQITDKGVE